MNPMYSFCPYYQEDRDNTFTIIKNSENISLMYGKKTQNLSKEFSEGALKTLNIFGKYIKSIFENRPIFAHL